MGFSRTDPTFTRDLRRLKLRPHQRLERPAFGGHVVQCAQLANAVELVQVEPVRPQPLQRAAQLAQASSFVRSAVLQPRKTWWRI